MDTKAQEQKPDWWVKAIDRLPQHQVMCHLKIHQDGKPYIGYYDYSLKKFMCPNLGPQGVKIEYVQWLDESFITALQSENQRLTEENEKLISLLKKLNTAIQCSNMKNTIIHGEIRTAIKTHKRSVTPKSEIE